MDIDSRNRALIHTSQYKNHKVIYVNSLNLQLISNESNKEGSNILIKPPKFTENQVQTRRQVMTPRQILINQNTRQRHEKQRTKARYLNESLAKCMLQLVQQPSINPLTTLGEATQHTSVSPIFLKEKQDEKTWRSINLKNTVALQQKEMIMSQTNSIRMKTFIEQLQQVQSDLKTATNKGEILKQKHENKSKMFVQSLKSDKKRISIEVAQSLKKQNVTHVNLNIPPSPQNNYFMKFKSTPQQFNHVKSQSQSNSQVAIQKLGSQPSVTQATILINNLGIFYNNRKNTPSKLSSQDSGRSNPYSSNENQIQRTASTGTKKRKAKILNAAYPTPNTSTISIIQELINNHQLAKVAPFPIQIQEQQCYIPQIVAFAPTLKYQILNGNNSKLVKKVLNLTRNEQWFETPASVESTTTNMRTQISHFHLRWSPTSKGINFERLSTNLFSQVVNHYEGHTEITTKNKLFKNIRYWHDERNESVFKDMLPLTFCIKVNTFDGEVDKYSLSSEMKEFKQAFNLLKENSEIEIDPQKTSQVFGKPDGQTFKNKQALIMPTCHFEGRNIWILKPTGLNRGKGIHVINSIKEVKKMIKLHCIENQNKPCLVSPALKRKQGNFTTQFDLPLKMNRVPEPKTFVIQKYIERPCLINKRKFDIRVWVLLDHNMDAFFFREGYLRTSCANYAVDNLDNDYVHLTNNAIQKNNPNYGLLEDGNQLSFADFKKMLKMEPNAIDRCVDFDRDILPRMKYQAAVTLLSVRKKINPQKRKHCFELFGLDYILDADLNVWLIEANTNPCLEESSKLLEVLLPRMIDDMFKLTIDKIFVPQNLRLKRTNEQHQSQYGSNNLITSVLRQRGLPTVNQQKESFDLSDERPSPFRIQGYKDAFNIWEKITECGRFLQRPTNEIQLTRPPDQYRKDDNVIHLVGQHELRVLRASLVEKIMMRESQADQPPSRLSKDCEQVNLIAEY